MQPILESHHKLWNTLQLADCLKSAPWVRHTQHIAELAIPFISLYKPQAVARISYGLKSWNTLQHIVNLIKLPEFRRENTYRFIKNLSEIAGLYREKKGWFVLNTLSDLIENIYDLSKNDPEHKKDKIEKLAYCTLTVLQLTALLINKSNSFTITIAVFLVQAALSFYQMLLAGHILYQEKQLRHHKTLDVIAKGLFGAIRSYQAIQVYKFFLVFRAGIDTLQQPQTLSEPPISNHPLSHLSQKIDAQHMELTHPIIDTLQQPQTLSEPPISNHPLSHLSQKIDAQHMELTHPISNEKYSLGSWLHGFGKGIVKWGNLCFNKITLGNQRMTTLSCRINNLYYERIEEIALSLKAFSQDELTSLAPFLGCKTIEIVNTKIEDFPYWYRSSRCGPFWKGPSLRDSPYGSFHFGALGSLHVGVSPHNTHVDIRPKHILVALNEERDIQDFHKFLSIFGLGDILEPFTVDDERRMKLGFLFKTFFPQASDALQKEQRFFDLPVDELQATMVNIEPQMEHHLKHYPVNSYEIFPGYRHPSIPIAQSIHDLGLRAVTACITGHFSDAFDEGDYDNIFDKEVLSTVMNILTNGLLSSKIKHDMGIGDRGFHGSNLGYEESANYAFAQALWKQDLTARKRLSEFGYFYPVRFYFSLDVLNGGSYQYENSSCGTREGPEFEGRVNILDFVRNFPFSHKPNHEVMLPLRILPEHIKAISLPSETAKKGVIDSLKTAGLIFKDSEQVERITTNGVKVEEFFFTEPHVTENTVKNCAPASQSNDLQSSS